MGDTSLGEMVTAVACKASGGKWKGGHDISGHVFLLTLGVAFLMQEVGWSVLRWSGYQAEERSVIMADGALKSANVESDATIVQTADQPVLGAGGKFAVAVMGLSTWMLLMTAIFFHTWFEKVSYSSVTSDDTKLTGLVYWTLNCCNWILCHLYCTALCARSETTYWRPRRITTN